MENQSAPERPTPVEPRTNWQQTLLFFADLFERVTGTIKRNCLDYLLPIFLYWLLSHYDQPTALSLLPLLKLVRWHPSAPKHGDKS